jgi:hypothetical protein
LNGFFLSFLSFFFAVASITAGVILIVPLPEGSTKGLPRGGGSTSEQSFVCGERLLLSDFQFMTESKVSLLY